MERVDGTMLLFHKRNAYLVLPRRAFAPGEPAVMRGYLRRAGVREADLIGWRAWLALGRRRPSEAV